MYACSQVISLPCLLGFRYKNQNVAIKIVHRGETPEEITKREARFAREVSMLSRVQHKNLAKVCFHNSSGISHTDLTSENEYHIVLCQTVYWCLQGAYNGDSHRAFIGRDIA